MGLLRFLYRNKSFILLCSFLYLLFWFAFGALKQPTNVKTTPVSPEKVKVRLIFLPLQQSNQLKHPSNSTFYYIIGHLRHLKLNLLLIDPNVLNDLFIDQLPFDQLGEELITFGITDQSIERFFPYLEEQKFSIKTSENVALDHVFIQSNEKIVHLAVLHPYHSYYLIQQNTLSLPDHIQLTYGDKLRAVEQ